MEKLSFGIFRVQQLRYQGGVRTNPPPGGTVPQKSPGLIGLKGECSIRNYFSPLWMFIWHICAKVTFTKQTKGSKVGFTHVEGSDLGHALMTWPKLLYYQLMFLNSNLILGMPKLFFGLDQKQLFRLLNFTFWPMSKKFWHSRNEIGFPKDPLEIQKFWTLAVCALKLDIFIKA